MTESSNPAPTAPAAPPDSTPAAPESTTAPATPPDQSEWPVLDQPEAAEASTVTSTVAAEPPAASGQTSMAAPRGLSYAVDIVFGIDVSGSMTPIIDQVKANALRFYDDVQSNLTAKGKNVDQLRVRVIAFRDFAADGEAALEESPFFTLPEERAGFSEFVNGLVAEGGGDAPESGLEAVALAIDSQWTTTGDRRRQVIVIWTDSPAQTLSPSVLPPDIAARVPADFSALTDAWEDEQGRMGSSSKRLIVFAPDGPGWSDISGVWENVVHHPHRPAVGCPRSTTGRSSTRSATRCERSRGRLGAFDPIADPRPDHLLRLQSRQDPGSGRRLRPDLPRRSRPGPGCGVRRDGRSRGDRLRDTGRAAYRRLYRVPGGP